MTVKPRSASLTPGHTWLVWTLACVLFAQGLIPIQSHTRWAQDDAGGFFLVCSWKGQARESERHPDKSDERRAPACVFSQLLTGVLMPAALVAPPASFQTIALQNDRGVRWIDLDPPRGQPIRGPPLR